MTATIGDYEVFWLAGYAHRTLAPLFNMASMYEPTIQYAIEMTFANPDSAYNKENSIQVNAHWARGGMLLQDLCLTTRAEVDRTASKVLEFMGKAAAE